MTKGAAELGQPYFPPMPDLDLPAPEILVTEPIGAEAERVGGEPRVLIEEMLRQERRRIAQVLHDTVCQELLGFQLVAGTLALQCQTSCPEAAEKLQVLTENIQVAGRKLIALMHTLYTEG